MGIGSNDNLDKLLVKKYSEKTCVIKRNTNSNEIPNFEHCNFVEKIFTKEDISNKKVSLDYKNCMEEFKSLANLKWINKAKRNKLKNKIEDLTNPNNMYERIGVDVIGIEVSPSLVALVEPDLQGSLLENILHLRYYLTDKYGFIMPNVRILDNANLDTNTYNITIRNKEVFHGVLNEKEVTAKDTMPIINAIQNMCVKYAQQVFAKTDALKLIELVRSQDPTLVNDLIPIFISATELKVILANLITERISIKDIILIFEILNQYAPHTQDVNKLTEILKKELDFMY